MESTTTHRYEPMSVDKSSDSFMHEGESTAVVRTSFVHFILLVSMITAKRWSEFLRRSCTLQNRDFRTGSTPDEAKPACSWKTPRIASYAVLGAFWKDAFAIAGTRRDRLGRSRSHHRSRTSRSSRVASNHRCES